MGWNIDVKSEQRYSNLEDPGYQSLLRLPAVDENLADQFFAKGIVSAAVVKEKTVEELTIFRSVDEEYAQQLIAAAAEIPVEKAADSGAEESGEDGAEKAVSSAAAEPAEQPADDAAPQE